ncbi:MAG TPA: FtsX-like permease family protein [Streptosporangiaceae bacterium]|jgi:putative ABC transport system permease protein
MSTALLERPGQTGTSNGGTPARRAVIRWAWRLLWREWRQQLLVLALVVVAVGATVVGAAVATNTPPPAGAGFGTAQDLAAFPPGPHLASQIAALRHRFGRVDVIENQVLPVPGSVSTYQLRAQDPHGPFGQPMLSLVSGHYPTGPGQVAVTSGVASDFQLKVGDVWRQDGTARRVVGLVQNPQSLLDEFALVAPGQVTAPSQVTVLFDAGRVDAGSLGHSVEARGTLLPSNPINPKTVVLALATVGMLLIALVSVGGFTVLAQRRLRSLGMLGALGATDGNVRLVIRANGVAVGVVGALAGGLLGLAAWLAYRPQLEQSAHHQIGTFALPWQVIIPAMILAVAATYFAASRPARAIARIPIVTALSGRPPAPKRVRRSALPGIVLVVLAFGLLTYAGAGNGVSGGQQLELIGGFILLVAALIMLSPLSLATLARIGRHAPVSARLAIRDLSRYRARSGSALAAISLGVFIAVVISVISAARYSDVLDYAGPNLTSSQLIVHTPDGPYGPDGPGGGRSASPSASQLRDMTAHVRSIASALGSHSILELDSTTAIPQHAASGRGWSGPLYVATPQLLHAYGITASQVDPAADILTMRPGLSGVSKMQLIYGDYFSRAATPGNGPGGGPGIPATFPCPKGACLASPKIQEIGTLPSGTSAPNSVITEHAVRELGLTPVPSGWLIQAPHPLTASQINGARLTAAGAGLNVETRSSVPTSAEIIDWATVFGILLALGILAMSVGLIRAEAASDLRTLTATGASGRTRRNITAATAGALALTGAVLGTAAAYVAAVAWFRSSQLQSLSTLTSVPVTNLLVILAGLPLAAAAGGWLFAGRQPAALAQQPLE